MQDLHNGDLTYTWLDDDIVFINSSLNALTFSLPSIDFLKFVKELNITAVKVTEIQKEEFNV